MNIPKTSQRTIHTGTAHNQNNAVLKKNEKLFNENFFLFCWNSKGFSSEQLGQNVASCIKILSQFRHCGITNPTTCYNSVLLQSFHILVFYYPFLLPLICYETNEQHEPNNCRNQHISNRVTPPTFFGKK